MTSRLEAFHTTLSTGVPPPGILGQAPMRTSNTNYTANKNNNNNDAQWQSTSRSAFVPKDVLARADGTTGGGSAQQRGGGSATTNLHQNPIIPSPSSLLLNDPRHHRKVLAVPSGVGPLLSFSHTTAGDACPVSQSSYRSPRRVADEEASAAARNAALRSTSAVNRMCWNANETARLMAGSTACSATLLHGTAKSAGAGGGPSGVNGGAGATTAVLGNLTRGYTKYPVTATTNRGDDVAQRGFDGGQLPTVMDTLRQRQHNYYGGEAVSNRTRGGTSGAIVSRIAQPKPLPVHYPKPLELAVTKVSHLPSGGVRKLLS